MRKSGMTGSASFMTASASSWSTENSIETSGCPKYMRSPARFSLMKMAGPLGRQRLCGDMTTTVSGSVSMMSFMDFRTASIVCWIFFVSFPPISGTMIGGCGKSPAAVKSPFIRRLLSGNKNLSVFFSVALMMGKIKGEGCGFPAQKRMILFVRIILHRSSAIGIYSASAASWTSSFGCGYSPRYSTTSANGFLGMALISLSV